MMSKDRRYLQMRKTILELLLDRQLLEQPLEHDQSCERRQSLIFKSNLWNLVLPAHYFDFARLHLRWPPALGIFGVGRTPSYPIWRPFYTDFKSVFSQSLCNCRVNNSKIQIRAKSFIAIEGGSYGERRKS